MRIAHTGRMHGRAVAEGYDQPAGGGRGMRRKIAVDGVRTKAPGFAMGETSPQGWAGLRPCSPMQPGRGRGAALG